MNQIKFPLVFILVSLLILFNLMWQYHRFNPIWKNFIHPHPQEVLGEEFVFLEPIFKKISQAGYFSCINSDHPLQDPRIMRFYQEAEVVLAPAILDYLSPFNHRYILIQCYKPIKIHQIQGLLSASVIADEGQGIVLLDRGARQWE